MSHSLTDNEWKLLLRKIKDGDCTPFVGAGACYGALPLGAEIAKELATEYGYPLNDPNDLAKVTQFVSITSDETLLRRDIVKRIKAAPPPDFTQTNEPHSVLAALPLPIYITTNYDDLLVRALNSQAGKKARQDLCAWNNALIEERIESKKDTDVSLFLNPSAYENITTDNPVVFHLHGHCGLPESLVLTEDDYLDFLVTVSRDQQLNPIPSRIQEAMEGTTLLFMGYKLADWDFKVLFRSISHNIDPRKKSKHFSVQIITEADLGAHIDKEQAQAYLEKYFDTLEVRMYWGTCREFAAELRSRWEDFNHGG